MKWWSFACFIEQTIGVVFRYIQGDVISRTAIFCFFLVGHLAFSVTVLKRVIKSIIIYLEINWNGGGGGRGLDFSEVLTSKNKRGMVMVMSNFAKKKWLSPPPFPTFRRLWCMAFFKNLFWLVSYSIVYMHVFYTQINTTANQLMADPHLITHLSA